MKAIKPSSLSARSCYICIYGESGVGKTYNSLKTLVPKIAYIAAEPRDYARTLKAIGLTDADIDLLTYDGFEDLLEFLAKPENFDPYESVLVDSLSYLMNIDLSREVGDESFESKADDDKAKKKPIETKLKLSLPNIGTVNKGMFRILEALGKVAVYGKTVVVTCLEKSNPKYNRELTAGPALSGREVPDNFPGFFDLIGHVVPALGKDGQLMYPPAVIFHSDGSFLAKATGDMAKKPYPLNFKKILNL